MNLRGLIEAVGSGTFLMDVLSPEHEITAYEAFSGSLDAAKRLHDALLPGWEWGRTEGNIFVKNPATNRWNIFWGGPNEVDARSFLLAILRALDDQREGGRDG